MLMCLHRHELARAASKTCLLLSLLALASGCQSLSYPSVEPEPEPQAAPAAVPMPTRNARVWTDLSRAGRDELRAGNLQGAESRFRAALAATADLPPHDARARAALSNLLRLGESYQAQGLYEDAARIASLVVDESRAGREPDFASAAPLLQRQGRYFESTDRRAEAEPLYTCALQLAGAGPEAGADYHALRLDLARLQLADGRFDAAASGLEQLLVELEPHAFDQRSSTRLALAVAEAARGETASAEREVRLAREEAAAAGPAAVAALRTKLANFGAWLRESGLESEASLLETLGARP